MEQKGDKMLQMQSAELAGHFKMKPSCRQRVKSACWACNCGASLIRLLHDLIIHDVMFCELR
jgi:hypothetical protein